MGNSSAEDSSVLTKKIDFPDHELLGMLCGEQSAHIKLLEKKVGLSVNIRGTDLILRGGDWEIDLAEKVLNQLYELLKNDYPIYLNDVEYAIRILSSDQSANLKKIFLDNVYISSNSYIKHSILLIRILKHKKIIHLGSPRYIQSNPRVP